jgi:hypothetical protein
MKKLLLLLCVPLMFSCGGDTEDLSREITYDMLHYDNYTGKGTLIHSESNTNGNKNAWGEKYIGEFRSGLKEGQGTWTNKDGDKYVGEWRANIRHGQGTYTWGEGNYKGDKYVGEYKDGKFNGQGTYTFADGKVQEGIWENGEFIGE